MPAEFARLEPLRKELLRVHRALLEVERGHFEAARGPVPNNMAFLQLVINDPWFEWLRPMAQMVLLIDERLSDKQQPLGAEEAVALYTQGRALLTPNASGDEFQQRLEGLVSGSGKLAVLLHHAQQGLPE